MSITLKVFKNNNYYDVTPALLDLTWSGDINSCARKIEFSLLSSVHDKNIKSFDIPLSTLVILEQNNKELFRGFIETRSKESGNNSIKYSAYDYCSKLNRIEAAYNFKNKLPSDIFKTVCNDYSLKYDQVASSSVKVKKIFLGKTLYEIIMTAYTEQSKSDGNKYMITSKADKFSVIKKGITQLSLCFEEGKNIISSNFEESVSDMVNRVIIVDDTGKKISQVEDSNLLKVHGLFQKVYKKEDDKNSTQEAKKMLNGITKTCSLEGFGDTTCLTGYGVQIKDNYTGLVGYFYIDSDTHTWSGGNYKISLKLNFKNIMHEVEAGDDEETSKSSSSKSTSSGKASSKAQKAVELAKSKLGCKYVWGATGPRTFDCSGLTSWCYKQVGISIPRTSKEQSKHGQSVQKSKLQVGDLVFFGKPVNHVGMYVGNGNYIHAPKTGDVVKISKLSSRKDYVNARRVG